MAGAVAVADVEAMAVVAAVMAAVMAAATAEGSLGAVERGANGLLSRASQRLDHRRVEHSAQAPPARSQRQHGTRQTAKNRHSP